MRACLFILLLAAACQEAPADLRSREAMRPSMEGVASERLAPLARFNGVWEGTLEGVSGNFRLAKRVSWLVPNSWLLEQTVAMDQNTGEEVDRSAAIYTVDPLTRQVEARLLQSGGGEVLAGVVIGDDGMSVEIQPTGGGGVASLTRTSLFNGREWKLSGYLKDENGGWQEANRMHLLRRGVK